MGRMIAKFNGGKQDYYLEWSTPVTTGVSREEFENYYRTEYGNSSVEFEFPRRMERVENIGTSSLEQIIDAYCVNTEWAGECPIEGTKQVYE